MKTTRETVTHGNRTIYLDCELLDVAAQFVRDFIGSADLVPCIYWREAPDDSRHDTGNFAAQRLKELAACDWFVVEGCKVYLDISPRQLDALEGKVLFWDRGIKSRPAISN